MSAINALKPFSLSIDKGGVKATFMQKMTWYEEYPTHPNSFVLNGCMYSLLGLYDLWKTLLLLESSEVDALNFTDDPASLSESLFNEGVAS